MLDPTFVAAVLEGFEGTLTELIERVEDRPLRDPLVALQKNTAGVRHFFENVGAALSGQSVGTDQQRWLDNPNSDLDSGARHAPTGNQS